MKLKNIIDPILQLKFITRKSITIKVPFEKKKVAERYRGSHYNDIDKCIGCGNCSKICMNEAIDMIVVNDIKEKEQDSGLRPRVDYGRCCYCGLCVDICPTGSLKFSNEFIQIETSPDKFMYIPGIEREHLKESISYTKEFSVNLQNLERIEMPRLEPDKRINSFAEEVLGYNKEQAIKEASRCMECGICVVGCPDRMHIPEYIKQIENGNDKESLRIMLDNNPLPEICGKVCTRHCEDLCVASIEGEAIAIRWLKRYVSENMLEELEDIIPAKQEKKNKKIAIIGAGPAGLTAAYYLLLKGYETEIFEEHNEIGGMIYEGIPRYRLPMTTINRQKKLLEYVGVKFNMNTKIGKDISFDELRNKYDAIFMGIGYHKSRALNIKGEDLPGILKATEFLKNINNGENIEIGKKVIVIGGGNVAIDAARVSRRLGAQVEIYYRRRQVDMPADNEEIEAAKEEGIKIIPQNIPLKFEYSKKDKSLKYYCAPAKMIEQPGDRPKPVIIEGELYCLENIDTIIIAIGQEADNEFVKQYGIFNERGMIEVDENGMTKVEGVFAGGDTVNKRNDVISAVADAIKAVKGISKYVNKR